MSQTPRGRRIELYVRTLTPADGPGRLERLLERLSQLEETDTIDGYAVHVVGHGVCPASNAAETAPGRFVLERFRTFERWAGEHGYSLSSFFEQREISSAITGESHRPVTFPAVSLAEFDGDELLFVAPCRDAGTVHRVDDRLDALEGAGTDPLTGVH